MKNVIDRQLEEHSRLALDLTGMRAQIEQIARLYLKCLNEGGKLIFMGNGGSAADAMHMSAEYVAKFSRERRGLPAITLSENISVITAIANDYNYDYVFARQLESLAGTNDLVIGISTSGESKNVAAAIEYCNQHNLRNLVFTGAAANTLSKIAQHAFIMPSTVTARIQEAYLFVSHAVCAIVEEQFT
ncbi:MAG: SIS domain-containing protein [bacterium]|nr:SIS domain-containing protein [bacterium]